VTCRLCVRGAGAQRVRDYGCTSNAPTWLSDLASRYSSGSGAHAVVPDAFPLIPRAFGFALVDESAVPVGAYAHHLAHEVARL
jgi:hypothetical protein